MTRTRTLAVGLLLAAVVPLAACGGGSDPLAPAPAPGAAIDLRRRLGDVGSAEFPEAALLGEIYAQALEAKGVSVTRQFNIGSRETYLKAITGGEVDVLPEYTGSLQLLRQERQGHPAGRGLRRAAEGPAGRPLRPRQVGRRGQELPGRHQGDRERVVPQGDSRPRPPPGGALHRRAGRVQDPPAGPRRPQVGLQHRAE